MARATHRRIVTSVKKMIAIGWVLLTAGCLGPNTLARSSVKHDQRADVLAELGDGEGAAYERWRGQSRLQQANLSAKRRGNWLYSDLTLQ